MANELELLRMHVDAVWSVRLPPLRYGDIEMSGGEAPPWMLYLGAMSDGRVVIWRHDVAAAEHEGLIEQALTALAQPAETPTPAEIGREVALHWVEAPEMDVTRARHLARRLTAADTALLETFEEGSAAYFLAPERAPLFGVVEHGRLVSIAHSSRRTAEACELGVDTMPHARRRGYGLAVTVRWAEAVAEEGVEPIYSALAENTASLALAHAAGYRLFVRGVSVMLAHPPAREGTARHR